MKILMVGDLHNQFNDLNALINKKHPDIVICCGDFGYWPNWQGSQKLSEIKPQGAKIYWIDGNHEDHWSIRDRQTDELEKDVIYMPRGSTMKLEDGRNILFMGGALSIDKHLRREGWDWFPEETISYSDMENLPEEKIDIFVTHTCPEELVDDLIMYYPEKRAEPSNYALSQLWKIYKPQLWIFGHWHVYKEGTLMGTKWHSLSYPRHGARWWMWLPERGDEKKD
jgi:Icc-related predicted phosphoesterase